MEVRTLFLSEDAAHLFFWGGAYRLENVIGTQARCLRSQRKAAAQLRKVLDEIWTYADKAGLKIGYVRDKENGVTPEDVLSGTYELEIACERYPAKVSLEPLYDPKMARVKA